MNSRRRTALATSVRLFSNIFHSRRQAQHIESKDKGARIKYEGEKVKPHFILYYLFFAI